jgi:hypothetical protein
VGGRAGLSLHRTCESAEAAETPARRKPSTDGAEPVGRPRNPTWRDAVTYRSQQKAPGGAAPTEGGAEVADRGHGRR